MDVDPTQIKTAIDSSLNDIFWWSIGFGAAIFFKNAIENLIWGFMFLWGGDYNVDDEVLIGDRKARIVRQTVTKTVFYLEDKNSRMIVPNKQLHNLKCEKILPGNKEQKS